MPLILDEISIRQELEIHGIQGAVVVTVQRIRPTKNDGDEFPTDLIDQSIGMIGVYPRNSKITPFYLNAKQTLEYTKDPQGRTIDIYGRTHRYDVKCAESLGARIDTMSSVPSHLRVNFISCRAEGAGCFPSGILNLTA
ncbi:MAG: hypothetical protein ACYS8O_06125 [Planctomycetota bacterium]